MVERHEDNKGLELKREFVTRFHRSVVVLSIVPWLSEPMAALHNSSD